MRFHKRFSFVGLGLSMFILSFAFAVSCFADPFPNSRCAPTTVPVTTCGCPNGVVQDRCEGSMPKIGNYYGNVACGANPMTSCAPASNNANSCGLVVMCPNTNCNNPIYWYPMTDAMGNPTCTTFPPTVKPPCTTTWGNCTYPPT